MSSVSKLSKEEHWDDEEVEEEEGESWKIGGMEDSIGSHIAIGWLSSSYKFSMSYFA